MACRPPCSREWARLLAAGGEEVFVHLLRLYPEPSTLRIMERGEMVLFIAVAIAMFVRGVHDLLLAPAQEDFAVTVTRAVNSVLFIRAVLRRPVSAVPVAP
jgi:hypothetical protein